MHYDHQKSKKLLGVMDFVFCKMTTYKGLLVGQRLAPDFKSATWGYLCFYVSVFLCFYQRREIEITQGSHESREKP